VTHKAHLFKVFLTVTVQASCPCMITELFITLHWHFQSICSAPLEILICWYRGLVDLWYFNDCAIDFYSVKNKWKSNTCSWPTVLLRLLQPTLSANNILQTADKARQKLQQLQNVPKQNMLSFAQVSIWGSVGYYRFENVFCKWKQEKISSFKRMWLLRSFSNWNWPNL